MNVILCLVEVMITFSNSTRYEGGLEKGVRKLKDCFLGITIIMHICLISGEMGI